MSNRNRTRARNVQPEVQYTPGDILIATHKTTSISELFFYTGRAKGSFFGSDNTESARYYNTDEYSFTPTGRHYDHMSEWIEAEQEPAPPEVSIEDIHNNLIVGVRRGGRIKSADIEHYDAYVYSSKHGKFTIIQKDETPAMILGHSYGYSFIKNRLYVIEQTQGFIAEHNHGSKTLRWQVTDYTDDHAIVAAINASCDPSGRFYFTWHHDAANNAYFIQFKEAAPREAATSTGAM